MAKKTTGWKMIWIPVASLFSVIFLRFVANAVLEPSATLAIVTYVLTGLGILSVLGILIGITVGSYFIVKGE